ncbi:hypothetical protein [Frisingicoccus sp.]|uniref:hypothetical protein n=1 Tax=Frisingicoccus sp. TaxID=1918627 RepID=UPI003AB82002
MFNFRIVVCSDGTEIIDRTLKTPYDSLTPVQLVEYTEMDLQLARMDKVERKVREAAVHRRKLIKNPFHKIGCIIKIF